MSSQDRPDLGLLLSDLSRRVVAMERPVLRTHGLRMWQYVVLTALEDGPVRGQLTLATAIGADKTRLIGVLDQLQERDLISREPDLVDRRTRVVALTPVGRRLLHAARRDVRAAEEDLLAELSPQRREQLLELLISLRHVPEVGSG